MSSSLIISWISGSISKAKWSKFEAKLTKIGQFPQQPLITHDSKTKTVTPGKVENPQQYLKLLFNTTKYQFDREPGHSREYGGRTERLMPLPTRLQRYCDPASLVFSVACKPMRHYHVHWSIYRSICLEDIKRRSCYLFENCTNFRGLSLLNRKSNRLQLGLILKSCVCSLK